MSDSWTSADDFEAATAGYDFTEPLSTAMAFISALSREPLDVDQLASVVTPESLPAWGNFSSAAAGLSSIPEWAIASYPDPAPNATDVAYVKILKNEPESRQQEGDVVVVPAAWITLIWRPERGTWLVHAFGNPLPADGLPRSSPGEAPEYTRAP